MERIYLTKRGLERLKKESRELLQEKKEKTRAGTLKMQNSADASLEYVTYQDEMGLLEARIAEHERILRSAELLKPPPLEKRDRVSLGATVTLEEEAPGRRINEYTLLGGIEANPAEGIISCDSPVGKSLLNKRVGDTIVISSPIRVVYRIKKITYHL